MKRLALILFAIACFCLATLLGGVAEARTVTKTKTTVVHKHYHQHSVAAVVPSVTYVAPPVTYYSSPIVSSGVVTTRPMTGGEFRAWKKLQRSGIVQ